MPRTGSDDVVPTVERRAVRIAVLDAAGRVLLLETRDPDEPRSRVVWQLPGGGLAPGEQWPEAAVRELHEETGLVVDPSELAQPNWCRTVAYVHRGTRFVQHEEVTVLRVGDRSSAITAPRSDHEQVNVVGFRWWSLRSLQESSERFYPGRMPIILPRAVRGDEVVEPFENWS